MNYAFSLVKIFLCWKSPPTISVVRFLSQSKAKTSVTSSNHRESFCEIKLLDLMNFVIVFPNKHSRPFGQLANQLRVHKRPWPLNWTSGFFCMKRVGHIGIYWMKMAMLEMYKWFTRLRSSVMDSQVISCYHRTLKNILNVATDP